MESIQLNQSMADIIVCQNCSSKVSIMQCKVKCASCQGLYCADCILHKQIQKCTSQNCMDPQALTLISISMPSGMSLQDNLTPQQQYQQQQQQYGINGGSNELSNCGTSNFFQDNYGQPSEFTCSKCGAQTSNFQGHDCIAYLKEKSMNLEKQKLEQQIYYQNQIQVMQYIWNQQMQQLYQQYDGNGVVQHGFESGQNGQKQPPNQTQQVQPNQQQTETQNCNRNNQAQYQQNAKFSACQQLCNSGHPMEWIKEQSRLMKQTTCHSCKKKKINRYCCVRCKEYYCAKCLYKNNNEDFCPNNHKMSFKQLVQKTFACDICMQKPSDTNQGAFQCQQCNFDICIPCSKKIEFSFQK